MKNIVIIMDVDGTLTNKQKIVSPKTKQILLKAQSQGARLVLASGRPVRGLMSLACELEMDKHDGLLVAFNGSKVVDCQTNEVLYDQTMSTEAVKAVLTHLQQFAIIPMIDKNDYMYVHDVYAPYIEHNGKPFNVIEYEARGGGYLLCEVKDMAEFIDFPVNKILTAASPAYLQAHYQKMMEPFADKLNCVFTAPFYFEFTAKGVDKASAIQAVLTKLGYKPEDMYAFGDAQNDITMIEYAGTGIAMGNACEELKHKADMITASNDEDGIALALTKLFADKLKNC
ncbi:MAG: Cof-type HAD-IIB family hydrolase [Erysipelotrichaceae bacterium]|nr:Cof-type HAD-IIB family hydrolase [Erysipelotrichaceae bacterium]MDY5252971.1 Cof-type HAD-IIB family hydrolase [Erysipelotrichaceae bacterium]